MANRILLTGAGFTHNFGAPLASEVSTLIFNSISNNNVRLLELLRNNFDYEDVYQIVMNSFDYDQATKNTLTNAIKNAYDIINDLIKNTGLSGIGFINFKEFIQSFSKKNNACFIFTLNQDLFIEQNEARFFETPLEVPTPGKIITSDEHPFERQRINISYNDFDSYKKKIEKDFSKNDPRLYYIKLHGTCDWYKEETQVMVLGHSKNELISTEPLLKWYFDIFNEQIRKNDTKLLIIGYSFRDAHINQAIYNHRENIKIYIINPQSFEDFSSELTNKPFGSEIKKLIVKYYAVNLIKLMGTDTIDPHPYWNQMQIDYFDNQYYKNQR